MTRPTMFYKTCVRLQFNVFGEVPHPTFSACSKGAGAQEKGGEYRVRSRRTEHIFKGTIYRPSACCRVGNDSTGSRSMTGPGVRRSCHLGPHTPAVVYCSCRCRELMAGSRFDIMQNEYQHMVRYPQTHRYVTAAKSRWDTFCLLPLLPRHCGNKSV